MRKSPHTWDAAAQFCLEELLAWSFAFEQNPPEAWFQHLKEEFPGTPGLEGWRLFGASMLVNAAWQLWMSTDDVSAVVQDLLVRKQHDYGSQNILNFGGAGIVVRICDKAARLENLRQRDEDPQVEDESVKDTLFDLVGYAVLGMMLERGWFELPLAREGVLG